MKNQFHRGGGISIRVSKETFLPLNVHLFCLTDGLLVRVQMFKLATKRKLNFSTYSHFSTIQVTDCMKEVIKQTALRRSLGGLGTGESVLRRVHP